MGSERRVLVSVNVYSGFGVTNCGDGLQDE